MHAARPWQIRVNPGRLPVHSQSPCSAIHHVLRRQHGELCMSCTRSPTGCPHQHLQPRHECKACAHNSSRRRRNAGGSMLAAAGPCTYCRRGVNRCPVQHILVRRRRKQHKHRAAAHRSSSSSSSFTVRRPAAAPGAGAARRQCGAAGGGARAAGPGLWGQVRGPPGRQQALPPCVVPGTAQPSLASSCVTGVSGCRMWCPACLKSAPPPLPCAPPNTHTSCPRITWCAAA